MRRRTRTSLLFVVTLLAAASAASARQRATAELVSSVATAARGQTFEVAVKFKIDTEWHLYWLNPGDTGRAPNIEWTASAGVTVGRPLFPVPQRIVSFAGMVPMTAYGYEHELVLLVPVTVGPEVQGPIELKAEADWIACKQECVAENQDLSLSIPVGDQAAPANQADFARWRALQPKREGGPKVEVTLSDDRTRGRLRVEVPEGLTPTALFPPEAPFAQFESPAVVEEGERKAYVASFRVLPGKHADRTDLMVVVFTDSAGKSVAYEVPCTFAMGLR